MEGKSTTVPNANGAPPKAQKQEETKGQNNSRPYQDKGGRSNKNRRQHNNNNGDKNSNNNNNNHKRNGGRGGGYNNDNRSNSNNFGKMKDGSGGYYNRSSRKARRPNDQKIKQLSQLTNGYWPEEVLASALKDNDMDINKAAQYLHEKRQSSWSNIVKQQVTAPFQPVNVSSPANGSSNDNNNPASNGTVPHNKGSNKAHKNNKRGGQQNKKDEEKPPAPEPEEEYNVDAKIVALQKQVETELRGVEEKGQRLTALLEEVSKYTAERDSQIETLNREKDQLCIKRQNLEQEIETLRQRMEQIDLSVAQLRQEKVQKVKVLEEKSRALGVLEDK